MNKFAVEVDPQTNLGELWFRNTMSKKKTATLNNIIQDYPELAKELMNLHLDPNDVYGTSFFQHYLPNQMEQYPQSYEIIAPSGTDRITYEMLKSLMLQMSQLILIDLNNY